MSRKHNLYILFLVLSVILHSSLLFVYKSKPMNHSKFEGLKIRTIRTLGVKDSKKNTNIMVQKKTKSQDLNDYSLSDLNQNSPVSTKESKNKTQQQKKSLSKNNKPIQRLSLNNQSIKNFVKSQSSISSKQVFDTLEDNDVGIQFEVPKGVELDKLNEFELKFYGFQKRVAIKYIKNFYQQLDKFQLENPHIKFPIVSSTERMIGKATYDRNGNIQRIKMLQWTKEDKLQQFFENLLQQMDTLQNPPGEIVTENDQFSIYFSLLVNPKKRF